MEMDDTTTESNTFKDYFSQFLLSIDSHVNINQEDSFYQEIYLAWIKTDHTNNTNIKSKLAQIGISDEANMDLVINQLVKMKEYDAKCEALLEKSQIYASCQQQFKTNSKFQIFSQRKHLENSILFKTLQDYDIQIKDQAKFVQKINQTMKTDDQQIFRSAIHKILSEQFSLFAQYQKQSQQNLLKLFQKRKISFKKIFSLFQQFFQNDAVFKLNEIYGNVIAEDQKPYEKIETQQQFVQRVKQYFVKNCEQFKKKRLKADVAQQLAKKLFETRRLQKILQILEASKIKQYKDKSSIPFEVIKNIYNINSQQQLQKQNQIQEQIKNDDKVTSYSTQLSSERKNMFQERKLTPDKNIKKKKLSTPENSLQKQKKQKSKSKKSEIKSQKKSKISQQKSNAKKQQAKQRQKSQLSRLQMINQQLNALKKKTNQKVCPEILLRDLQKYCLLDDQVKIKQTCNVLLKMGQKYQYSLKNIEMIETIGKAYLKKDQRISKVNLLRRAVQILNMQQIILSKLQLESFSQCNDGNAVILVGKSGTGKTTTINGFAGNKIIFNKQKQTYQPADPQMALKYKIGTDMLSQTRWANVAPIPKDWVKDGTDMISIDTPGLGDNRSVQIDICNNLGTMKLLQKLKSARIVIFISEKQFTDKWYAGLKQIIVLASNYLVNVQNFSRSITFVLTKKLTRQKLLNNLLKFIGTQNYTKQSWTQSQIAFIDLLKDKMDEQDDIIEIHQPSQHKYKDLMKQILKKNATQNPGKTISASFSAQSLSLIRQTYSYLENMIKKTFNLAEFDLTLYYLNQLKQLEEISPNKSYINLIDFLKKSFESKLKQIQFLFQRFIAHNLDDDLNAVITACNFLKVQQSLCLFKILYQPDQKNPLQKLKILIDDLLKDANNMFSKPSQIVRQERRKALSYLRLMKQFKSKASFDSIKDKIQNQNHQINKNLQKILKSTKFKKSDWDDIVKSYCNMFTLDKVVSNQIESYQNIAQIVLKYIDSNPQQLDEINRLIKEAETKFMDEQLYNCATKYLTKLTIIKQTNFVFRDILQAKIKAINKQLEGLIVYFENQKQIGIKNLDLSLIQLWEVYQINKKQVYSILQEFDTSQTLSFMNLKQQESLLKSILNNLNSSIQELEKTIQKLSLSPQSIEPKDINDQLNQIFALIKFIKKRKQTRSKKQVQNPRKIQNMTESIQKAQLSIQKIITKIQRINTMSKVQNYELNYKLLVCLIVLKQFSLFITDQKQLSRLKEIQKSIKQKLLSPLTQMKEITFQNQYQFSKLYKVLVYMKHLDQKTLQIGLRSKGFQFVIDFKNNTQIINILNKCFKTTKQWFQKSKVVVDLAQFQAKYQFSNNKQAEQLQKQNCLSSLNYSLVNSSVQYILSFNHIIKIVDKFCSSSLVVQQFNNVQLKKSNLKSIIIQRMKLITDKINSPIFKQNKLKKDLLEIQRQFTFLYKVHQDTRNSSNHIDFIEAKKQIDNLLAQYLSQFADQLQKANQMYKHVDKGVNFDFLKKMIVHPGLTDGKNKKDLTQLFERIEGQYSTVLKNIFINFNVNDKITQKTDVFLNIYQFMQICKNEFKNDKQQENQNNPTIKKFKYNHNLDIPLLEKNCQRFFNQLKKQFDFKISQIQRGITCNERQVAQLIRYQKKIQIYLKQYYQKFLADNSLPSNLQTYFYDKKQQLQNNLHHKYIDQFKPDANLKTVYLNTTPQNQLRIKKSAVQNQNTSIQNIKKYIQSDHQKLLQIFDQKVQQLELLPQQIALQFRQKYQQLNIQKQKTQKQSLSNANVSVQKKNPTGLLAEYQKGDSIKSRNIKNISKKALQVYYEQEKKELDFNNLNKLQESLKRNLNFSNSQKFKKISQTEKVVKQIHQQYIKSVQKETSLNNKSIQQQIFDLKKTILQKNPTQKFKFYDFSTVQSDVASRALKMAQFTGKFDTVLEQQHKQIIKIVEDQIKLESQNLEFGSKQLEQLRKKMAQRQLFSRDQFIEKLRLAKTSREACVNLKSLNKIKGLTKTIQQQNIDYFDTVVSQTKQNIKTKYSDAQKWSLQSILTSSTLEIIAVQNQQIQKDLKILDRFSDIFFSENEIPQKVLQKIQQKNLIQFQQLKSKTLEQIRNSFKTDNQFQCDKVTKFYDFQRLYNSTQLVSFPPQLKIDSEVKNLLTKQFKNSTQKIQNFISDKKQIDQFKKISAVYQNINQQQKLLIKQKTQQIQNQKTRFIAQHQIDLDTKIKLVDVNDQKKDEKIKEIQKQFQGNKLSKLNDFATIQNKYQTDLKATLANKKSKVTKQINDFVYQNFAMQLIINRRARSFFYCQEQIKNYPITIESLLEKLQKNYSKKMSRYLYNCLKQSNNSSSHTLIDEQKIFRIFRATIFAELTKGQTFDKLIEAINDIINDPDKKQNMIFRYKEYTKKYDKLLQDYKNSHDYSQTKRRIVNQITLMGTTLKDQYQKNKKTNVQRWILLAYIFALWTILKAQVDEDNNIVFIHKPHPGQVLAIFLLLQFDLTNPSNSISKAMVQVSTGEGKSVILGTLSAYLALVGFRVYEACYSQYLSGRDYKDFEDLFICLSIQNRINYSIFPEICKLMLDQSPQKPFAAKVEKFIINPSFWDTVNKYFSSLLPQDKKRQSILLIDQADVFLDQTYLGQSYYPTINIRKKSVENLLDAIWNLRDKASTLMPPDIVRLKQFKQLCKQINNPTFQKIMENQTNAMIRDLLSYKNDAITLVNGKIFYKQGDGLSDKIHYGYRTIWAYYHEHYVNKQVSAIELNKQIVINLIIAAFSYSKLPQYFNTILGVTGTLISMSDGQKTILKNDFGVKKQYVQPSIYPASKRKISFKRCYNVKLYQQIVKNIDQQHKKKRPVIVFLKNKSNVYDFFESKEFAKYKTTASIITYEVRPEDRDFRIQVSTLEDKITLLTYDFSRGTDFKLKVKDSQTHPGLHVICGFLPTSFSDYIQLAGRTGRQGKNGSVLIFEVEDQQVPQNKMNISQKQAEQIIREKDNQYWATKIKQINLKMEKTNKKHQDSMNIYSSGASTNSIFENLRQLNEQIPLTRCNSKTAICIDATVSMSAVFPKVIQVVNGAMPDIYKAIQQAQIQGSFQIKFVVYRNYNSSADLLLQFCNFESKSDPLVKWLSGIRVDGGWANEAVQVCLDHINKLQSIDQCVIIADAKANTAEQTKIKRQNKGDSYWDKAGFRQTSFDIQLQKIKQKKIKIHSYYLNSANTSAFYQNLSKQTNGIAQQFKINAQNATKNFANFVADKILSNLGQMIGGDAKEKLLKMYASISAKKKYV